MAALMEMLGVPRDDILVQNDSLNTQQDAEYSCAIIKEKGYMKVILVTSAFHMPRSVALFEAQGCPVIPAPVDYSVTEDSWNALFHPSTEEFFIDLLPSYTHLSAVTKSMKEYLGMIFYHLTGVLR